MHLIKTRNYGWEEDQQTWVYSWRDESVAIERSRESLLKLELFYFRLVVDVEATRTLEKLVCNKIKLNELFDVEWYSKLLFFFRQDCQLWCWLQEAEFIRNQMFIQLGIVIWTSSWDNFMLSCKEFGVRPNIQLKFAFSGTLNCWSISKDHFMRKFWILAKYCYCVTFLKSFHIIENKK